MKKSLLVPALALGVALSGSAFGHSWSAKMTGQPHSANSRIFTISDASGLHHRSQRATRSVSSGANGQYDEAANRR